MVEVLVPLEAVIVPGAADTSDWPALGAPAAPVAVKVTGLPLSPGEVAVSVLAPAAVPRVQLPTVAMPLAPVVWVAPVMLPLPAAAANVTETPDTGFPFASRTTTDGAVATAVFTVAVWPLPALTAMLPALPAVPVAVKVTGLPVSPDAVAVRVFTPALVPSVQDVTAASPPAVVVTGAVGFTVPPPVATANVTATPETGFPLASVTITDGATGTAVPAVIVWLLPALRAIVAAGPALTVTVAVSVTMVAPFTVAVTVFVSARVELSVPVICPLAGVGPAGWVSVLPVVGATASVTVAPLTGLPN